MTRSRKSLFLVCGVVFLTMTAAPVTTAASGVIAIAPAVQSLPIMGEPSASLSERIARWLDRIADAVLGERAARATVARNESPRSLSSGLYESRVGVELDSVPPRCSGGDEATGPWPVD